MKTLFHRAAAWVADPDGAPDDRTDGWSVRDLARVAVSTASLLAVFLLLNRFVTGACRLPEAALGRESILASCVAYRSAILLPGLAVYGVLVVAIPRLRQGWDQFDGGSSLRWFVAALAAILAWAGSGYAYNAWYDQPHTLDRGALVLFAVLVCWRPGFVLPFVIAFWAVIWQFDAPRLSFQNLVAEFRPVVNTLTLFASALLVQALWRSRKMHGFLFLTLCIVAADFWVPGYTKLRIGWLSHGHVYLLLPNAYTHGWLAFLEPESVAWMTRALALADWPMRIGTICIECGALFVFAGWRTARGLLLLFTLLLGVFFLTLGYFFWKWMVLQLLLWVLLFRTSGPAGAAWRRDLFTRGRFAVAVVVIGTSMKWLSPAALAWFDTPLVNTIRYTAIGRSGAVYDLAPAFFAPYESHVAMGAFVVRLSHSPIIATAYGVSGDRRIADALLEARTPADVIRLEDAVAARGTPLTVDAAFEHEFEEFVRRTASVSNRRFAHGVYTGAPLALLRPPPFLWTFSRGTPYAHQEPIASVRVYRVSSLYDGRTYALFRRELLRMVTVPS